MNAVKFVHTIYCIFSSTIIPWQFLPVASANSAYFATFTGIPKCDKKKSKSGFQ